MRNAGGTFTNEYMIKDQQGNVRVSFEDNSGTAVVRQENSFYPYGLTMPGSALPSADNKRLYNGGSEWQNDFADLPDLQQTFYRNGACPEEGWNPSLGRFVGADPLPESAGGMTPYQYAMDNPVMMNDPMGDQYQQSGAGFWLPSHRIGPGSGNHWSDGMNLPDWDSVTGSELYREARQHGYGERNGNLTLFLNGSDHEIVFKNGVAGFYLFGTEYVGNQYVYYNQFNSFLEGPILQLDKSNRTFIPINNRNSSFNLNDIGSILKYTIVGGTLTTKNTFALVDYNSGAGDKFYVGSYTSKTKGESKLFNFNTTITTDRFGKTKKPEHDFEINLMLMKYRVSSDGFQVSAGIGKYYNVTTGLSLNEGQYTSIDINGSGLERSTRPGGLALTGLAAYYGVPGAINALRPIVQSAFQNFSKSIPSLHY